MLLTQAPVLLGPHWAVLSYGALKYSPCALNSGGPFQIFALNRTSAYLCRFLNGINEMPFSTFLNLGAIVCMILTRPMTLDHVTWWTEARPQLQCFTSYTVTTSSPLWGFYFWHFKCWICCLVFKNPNQNVRTRGQSRTTAQGLQWGCQVHTGPTKPSGWLGSLSASDQKKRCRTKAHWPLLTVFTSWCYQITSQHEEPNLENANWERI